MLPLRYSTDPFSLLRNEVDRLFDDFLESPNRRLPGAFMRSASYPAFNAWENSESYYLEAECPGLKIGDLEISVAGNQLTISGERKTEYPEKTAFHRRERGTGRFSRVLSLPAEVDADKVEARLTNGVLTVQLPKAQSAKPRKIQVRS